MRRLAFLASASAAALAIAAAAHATPIVITRPPVVIASVAALRTSTLAAYPVIELTGYAAAGDNGGGDLQLVASDTTSADDGCTVFVDAGGDRFHRAAGALTPQMCGAPCNPAVVSGDGGDTPHMQAWVAALGANREGYVPQNSTCHVASATIGAGGLALNSNTAIKGGGITSEILETGTTAANLFVGTNVSNISFDGLELYGNGVCANNSAGCFELGEAILIWGTSGATAALDEYHIRHNRFDNFGGDAWVTFLNQSPTIAMLHGWIEDNTFISYSGNTFLLSGANLITQPADAISLNGNASGGIGDFWVKDNYINADWLKRGVIVWSFATNVSITGNTIDLAGEGTQASNVGSYAIATYPNVEPPTFVGAISGNTLTVSSSTFTGSISGTTLTTGAVTGSLGLSNLLSGAGVPAGLTIVQQLTGTQPTCSPSCTFSLSASGGTIGSEAMSTVTQGLQLNMTLAGAGLLRDTTIAGLGTTGGGNGVYTLNKTYGSPVTAEFMRAQPHPAYITVSGNTIKNPYSVGLYSEGTEHITVTGNIFNGQRDTANTVIPKGAVVISSGYDAVVSDNQFNDNWLDITVQGPAIGDGVGGFVINGNRSNNVTTDFALFDYSTMFNLWTDAVVEGNQVYSNQTGSSGLVLATTATQGIANMTITGNTFRVGNTAINLDGLTLSSVNTGHLVISGNVLQGGNNDIYGQGSSVGDISFIGNTFLPSSAGYQVDIIGLNGLSLMSNTFTGQTSLYAMILNNVTGTSQGNQFIAETVPPIPSVSSEMGSTAPTWAGPGYVQDFLPAEAGTAGSKYLVKGWLSLGNSSFTASIASSTLTTGAVTGTPLTGGSVISGASVPAATTITAQLTGTQPTCGGGCTFSLANGVTSLTGLTVSSEAMTAATWVQDRAPTGN